MFVTAVQTGIVIASIVGSSLAVPAISDEVPPDEPSATSVRAPRPVAVAEAVGEILGVSRGDVISVLRTEGTLAELAVEAGSSGDALADALLAGVDHRIEAALAVGTIDDARAGELRAAAAERVDRLVFQPHWRIARPGPGRDLRSDVVAAAEAELDLPRGRIVAHLRTGGTLAELASDNGSSGAHLVASMLDVVDRRLDRAVADGRIDEDGAADLLEKAEQRLIHIVYDVHVPGRGR